jgi:uncharacterized protein DUF4112
VAIDPRHERQLTALRAWARLLDNQFRVPVVGARFGLDPIIGLIPVLGDITTPVFSALVVLQAFRMGIPKVIQARMLLNVLIDMAAGALPVVGDLFDFAWQSNVMNMRLLERHAYEVVRPKTGDWVFVSLVLAALAACVIVPLAAFVYLIHVLEALRG